MGPSLAEDSDLTEDSDPTEDCGYVFDNDSVHSHEQHRGLTAAYDPITLERLAATGVTDGWRCLDVGAGGGSVAAWLADRVAPSGEVLATDIKTHHLAHLAERPGLLIRTHDVVADPLPEAAFDLIVARLVLQHLPERHAVLRKLVRALKPGGRLQIDELDASYEPPLLTPDESAAELYRTFLRAKAAALRAGGGDPHWGQHVPAAMHAAGLVDIDPRPYLRLRRPGSAETRLQLHHTHHLREKLMAAGLTERQLHEVRALLRSPSFCAVSSTLYSVQGRRPEGVSGR